MTSDKIQYLDKQHIQHSWKWLSLGNPQLSLPGSTTAGSPLAVQKLCGGSAGTCLGSVIEIWVSRGHLLCSFHKIFELFLWLIRFVTLLICRWVTEKPFHHADVPLISVMLCKPQCSPPVFRLRQQHGDTNLQHPLCAFSSGCPRRNSGAGGDFLTQNLIANFCTYSYQNVSNHGTLSGSHCNVNLYIVKFVLKIYILAHHMNMFSLPTQAFEQFAVFCQQIKAFRASYFEPQVYQLLSTTQPHQRPAALLRTTPHAAASLVYILACCCSLNYLLQKLALFLHRELPLLSSLKRLYIMISRTN